MSTIYRFPLDVLIIVNMKDKCMKDPWYAYKYARDSIRGRWPEAEPIIMKDADAACDYAIDIIQGRWPEAEPYIMKDAESAWCYAKDVIKGRWPEAEPYIMQDPSFAYEYAKDVIMDRWPEAEPIIMQDPRSAYEYARDVIGGMWPEAEPYIMKDAEAARGYKEMKMEKEDWKGHKELKEYFATSQKVKDYIKQGIISDVHPKYGKAHYWVVRHPKYNGWAEIEYAFFTVEEWDEYIEKLRSESNENIFRFAYKEMSERLVAKYNNLVCVDMFQNHFYDVYGDIINGKKPKWECLNQYVKNKECREELKKEIIAFIEWEIKVRKELDYKERINY